jgi:diguanylate cyclase (GGDEF)-like protein/PAS domain S-box-containing protein
VRSWRRRHILLAGIAVLLALVSVFWLQARRDQSRLIALGDRLQTLDSSEWRLNESVFRLRYGLVNNYDPINQLLAQMRQSRQALKQAMVETPTLAPDWEKYEKASIEREDVVERFKFEAAVIRNSVQFFSHDVDTLSFPQGDRGAKLHEKVTDLSDAVLRLALAVQPGMDEEVGQHMKELEAHMDHLPLVVEADLRRLLRHASIVRDRQLRLEQITRSLTRSSARAELDALMDIQAGETRREFEFEARIRLFLALLSLLLLATVTSIGILLLRERARLDAERQLVASLTEQAGVGVIACDRNGLIRFANDHAHKLLGWEPGSMVSSHIHQRLHAHAGSAEQCPVIAAIRSTIAYAGETEFSRADGKHCPVELRVTPAANDKTVASVLVFQDISERLQRERDQRLADTVFVNSQQGIMVSNADGVIERVNPAYCAITGYEEAELVGANPRILKSGFHDAEFYRRMWQELTSSGRWEGEIRNRRKDGTNYVQWVRLHTTHGSDGLHYVGIVTDITEYLRARESMERLHYYDSLTRLPNRALFVDRLRQSILNTRRSGDPFGLMLIDLDNFKNINDGLGHSIGDEVLVQVAERLLAIVGESDTVARLGGDEFALLITNRRRPEDLARLASNIVTDLQRPFQVNGGEVRGGGSVGISVCPSDGDATEPLLRNAEVAMYRAKEKGRGRFQFFVAEMAETVLAYMQIENGLRRALEQGGLRLHYQPMFHHGEAHPFGAEALLRWTSPELGEIPPSQFIPVAESSGLIVAIDNWVLNEACRQAAEWQTQCPGFQMAVNISADRFGQEGMAEDIRKVLETHGLPGSCLELEITERVTLSGGEHVRRIMEELKALGCRLSIDDFGTGYSSLSYLQRLPVDTLKIDKSFVDGLGLEGRNGDGRNDNAVVAAIIGLARSLTLGIVAEGVERQAQMDVLHQLGGDEKMAIQGFFLSKPVPADEFARNFTA